jgi:hypothetical protein
VKLDMGDVDIAPINFLCHLMYRFPDLAAMDVVMRCIASHPYLTELDAKVMTASGASLKRLCINVRGGIVTPHGREPILSIPGHTELEELYLFIGHFRLDIPSFLLQIGPSLKRLHICVNNREVVAVDPMSTLQLPNLTQLSISHSTSDTDLFAMLVNLLRAAHRVESLTLRGRDVEASSRLLDTMNTLAHLQTLTLDGPVPAKFIFHSSGAWPNLTEYRVELTEMNEEIGALFVPFLEAHKYLASLEIKVTTVYMPKSREGKAELHSVWKHVTHTMYDEFVECKAVPARKRKYHSSRWDLLDKAKCKRVVWLEMWSKRIRTRFPNLKRLYVYVARDWSKIQQSVAELVASHEFVRL